MSNKNKSLRPPLDRAVATLVDHHQTNGDITSALFKEHAAVCGYSVRHLRRCVNNVLRGAEQTPDRFEVTDEVITAVFLTCGLMAGARRLLLNAGHAVPSLRTFQRHVVQQLGTGQLTYARLGSAGFRNAQVYLKNHYGHRMHSVLLDHTELPIWVIPRGYKQAQKPWMTVVMDGHTRYPLSWVLTWGRPSAEEVRAALMQAFTLGLAPDGETVIGGRPLRAVWDRGLEFLSNLITESCLRLRVVPVALPAYSPHLKGRLERFWRFIKTDLCAPLPGYTEGPQDLRGNSALATSAMGEDAFMVLLIAWMDHYVTEHVNSSTGLTALQMWRDDPTPLDEIPIEQLRIDFLLAKERCKVSKNGIRFDRIDFVAPELKKFVGRTVEVRHLPHDRTFIEIFADNDHLCTAYPVENLSAEQEQEVQIQRSAERSQAKTRYSRANRLRTKTHDAVRLEVDKQGRRHVIEATPEPDLLSGGGDALKRILGDDDPDLQKGRLF